MTSKLTIEHAKRLRNDFECWQQDYDPKDDKEQYDMFGRGMAAMDMLIAGMYQEPVGEFYEDGSLNWYQISDGDRVPAHRRIPLYRHAQQPVVQPAVIPEWTSKQCLEFLSIAFRHAEIKGDLAMDDIRLGIKMVNANRVGMLQAQSDDDGEPTDDERIMAIEGIISPISSGNSPVIPDDWIPCCERLPPEGYEPGGGAVCYIVWHKNEVNIGPQCSISNVFFLRKHWETHFTHWMPLPAGPQELKP